MWKGLANTRLDVSEIGGSHAEVRQSVALPGGSRVKIDFTREEGDKIVEERDGISV